MTTPDNGRDIARRRLKLVATHAPIDRPWYRLAVTGDVTEVYLYGEIGDSWLGGTVAASDLVAELSTITTAEIRVHIHSLGGDPWEALAIRSALRQHPAKVTTIVDGIAASAASVVAMAGDEVVMTAGSEMMIHDASGLCIGDAALMRTMADDLDRESGNIAGIYAAKAGGGAAKWRKAMITETWYSAEEAVTAGLADRVADGPPATAAADSRMLGATAPDTGMGFWWDAHDHRYACRAEAPRPVQAGTSDSGIAQDATGATGGVVASAAMDLSVLRSVLDLADDASDEDVISAAAEGLTASPEPPEPTPLPGTVVVDEQAFAELQRQAAAGAAAAETMAAEARQRFISAAISSGRLTPANTALRETLEREWDRDRAAAQRLVNSLPVVVATSAIGDIGDDTAITDAFTAWEAEALPSVAAARAARARG